MAEYKVPEEYFFRLHHVRPRFKGDIENVLIYVAEEISRVGEKEVNKLTLHYSVIREMPIEK